MKSNYNQCHKGFIVFHTSNICYKWAIIHSFLPVHDVPFNNSPIPKCTYQLVYSPSPPVWRHRDLTRGSNTSTLLLAQTCKHANMQRPTIYQTALKPANTSISNYLLGEGWLLRYLGGKGYLVKFTHTTSTSGITFMPITIHHARVVLSAPMIISKERQPDQI